MSHGVMTARSSSVAAVLVLALVACKPQPGAVAPTGGGPGGGAGGPGGVAGTTPGGIVHGGPVAAVSKPAELLPAGTLAMFEATSPARVAEVLGREQLVHRFAQQYRELSREIIEETGHDLLDPKALPQIGVDPDGRIGAALVAVDREAIAFWWTLRDPARFRSWVIERIGKNERLTSQPYAGAEVLRIDDDAALVIRAPYAELVLDERELPPEKALAHAVATVEPGRSLAQAASFRKATGALGKGDAWGYVDFQEIARRAGAEMEKRPVQGNWAAEELAAARQRGEKPERIAELERQVREVDEQNRRWREREQAQAQLAKTLMAGIEGAGFSMRDKKGGPVFEMQIVADEGSLAKKLWKNLDHVPVVSQVASGTPGILLSLSLDAPTAFEMVEMFAKAEGEPWPEVVGEVRKLTGLDLDKDIRPLLAGSGGAAVTMDGPPRLGDPKALAKQVDFIVHVEVTDPAKAKAALATAARTVAAAPKRRDKQAEGGSREPTVVRDAKTGGLRITPPDFKPILVAVAGRQLVVTSDAAVLGRIEAGKSGDIAKKADPKAAFSAFTRPGQAGAFYVDAAIGALTFLGRSMSPSDGPILFEDPETAKIPKSREFRAKEKEIRLLDVRIEAAQVRRAKVEEERMMRFVRPWGVTVIAGAEDKRGITLTGGQFLRGDSFAKVVEEMLAGILEQMAGPGPEDGEMFKLFDERSKKMDELRQIRDRDVARIREKKPR
jgi:hypothetical protein